MRGNPQGEEIGTNQMEPSLAIAIFAAILAWFHLRRWGRRLPPGPYPYPIIGNILQLGRSPHKSLTALSKTHGPLISLQLGSILTVVASSPASAKMVLQEHDQVFSGRTISAAAEAHGFHKISIGLIPAGERWRKLRKLCREQLFSARRLEAGEGLRREKLRGLVDHLRACSDRGRAVSIGEAAFVTTMNLVTVTLASVDLIQFDSDATQELKETVEGVTKILGAPNVADFFPLLKGLDPQGIKRRSELYIGKLLGVFEGIINERLEARSVKGCGKKDDLLDTLVDLMEGSEYALRFRDVQQLLVDLFVGGSDTTQCTLEWAMTELLANPAKMSNAKNEVRSVVGETRQVEESDISRLPYLRAVVKETLRLHPPAPFLIPRRADRDIEMGGYRIPRDAQIFVNVWAIGRDPSIWPNPNSFEPERFLDTKIEMKGQDFGLLPFGSGRRMCPGVALGDRLLHLMLGSLLYNFDWKLETGLKPEDVDTTEEFGMALHKATPLKAIPHYCF